MNAQSAGTGNIRGCPLSVSFAGRWFLCIMAGLLSSTVALADITVDAGTFSNPAGKMSVSVYGPIGFPHIQGRRTLALPDGPYIVADYGGTPVFGGFTVSQGNVVATTGGVKTVDANVVEADPTALTPVTLNVAALTEPAGAALLRLGGSWEGSLALVEGAGDVTYYLPSGTFLLRSYSTRADFGTFTVASGTLATFTGSLVEAAPGRVGFNLQRLARVDIPEFSTPAGLLISRVADDDGGIAVFWNNTGTIYLPAGHYRVVNYNADRTFGTFDVVGTVVSAASGGLEAVNGTLARRTCGLATLAITVPPHARILEASGYFKGTVVVSLPAGAYTLANDSGGQSAFTVGDSLELVVGGLTPGTTIVAQACSLDLDQDGVEDSHDNCINTANADQVDQDQDGVGNACDPDLDGDGVANAQDSCPDLHDDQLDADGDGRGNACDDDDDGDLINDIHDNCLLLANTDQADADQDGVGDQCDADDDGDSVADVADNCPYIFNPAQTDYDGDGEGDTCDGDGDGDGVANAADQCPGTSLGLMTGADGCSGNEAVARLCVASTFPNHGGYVSCVARESGRLVMQGLLTPAEKARMVSQAARSR